MEEQVHLKWASSDGSIQTSRKSTGLRTRKYWYAADRCDKASYALGTRWNKL